MKNNVLFRVDSSSEIGLGHLMRCLVLAQQYKKENIIFATQDLNGNANHKIINKNYELIILNNNSPSELCKYIKLMDIGNVIFDHYGIDNIFEKTIKDKTGVKILSFDDTYNKHYCDILLNHNICADVNKYKGLVPKFCEVRCGKEYTLIRDEFYHIKIRKRLAHSNIPVIFLCLGGADVNNINLKVLKILANLDNIIVNLATTSANKNISNLKTYAKAHQSINICVDYNVAELMNKSDLAIITPSVISHEAMFLGLPFIAIKTADNQEIMYQYLRQINSPVLKLNDLKKIPEMIRKYDQKD